MDRIFPASKCAAEIVGVLAKYHTPVAMIDEVLATAKDIAEASTIVERRQGAAEPNRGSPDFRRRPPPGAGRPV